jgi:ABC-type transporter Mla subunit MlaD
MAVATQKIVIHADDRTAAAIQSAIRNSQKLDKALNNTADTMRRTTRQGRAQMAQLGHQVQDVAVQYQMGMNPLMILGQQGSQVASVFGSRGPLIGAFIAIAAVMGQQLLPSLFEATKSLEDLKKVNDDVADSLFNTSEKAKVLSDSLIEMAREDSIRAIIDLRKQLIDLRKNIQDSRASAEELGEQFFSTFGYGVGENVQKIARQFQSLEQVMGRAFRFEDVLELSRISELRRFITEVKDELGFTEQASVDFSRAIFNLVTGKNGSVKQLDEVLRNITKTMGDDLNPEAIQLIQQLMNITGVMKDSQDNISVVEALLQTLSAGYKNLGDTSEETKDKTKDFNESMKDQAP